MQTHGFYLTSLLIQVATTMDFSTTLKEIFLFCATHTVDCTPRLGEQIKKKKRKKENTGRIYDLI